MVSAIPTAWYQHAGGAMLRAASLPVDRVPRTWPALADPESCRSWLAQVWALPGFADAVGYASQSFATQTQAVISGQITDGRRVRRVTLSVVRYLLRSVGRPTPFGLFAGVAPAQVKEDPHVVWGADHRAVVRADTLWLDDILEQLETSPDILPHLDVVVCDLIVERGDRIELPRGPGRVSLRNTAVLRLIRGAAARPVNVTVLSDSVAEAFPGVPRGTIHDTLRGLVGHQVLVTNLRAPMTITDPLGYAIDVLDRIGAGGTVDELREIHRTIEAHNVCDAGPAAQARLRDIASQRMRRLSAAGRATLAGDLHLDCDIAVPAGLADEMAYAVTALLRLTRQPRPDRAWNDWCREFWERYGTGAVVPVTEAVHPDAGIGWPAGFPATMLPEPENTVSRRDEMLLRLAWEAVTAAKDEVVLTDELITTITDDEPVDPRWIPAHVELGARVHAATIDELSTGEYRFTVHPAWAIGTLTSRFGPAVARAGLDVTYAGLPAGVDGALAVQMSFPPLFPHSENVARVPAWLPHVLPLGEHRPDDDPTIIHVDDLGLVAVADGLHLVSISQRRVIEPQVFHALALHKQAPPLARFLATVTRGFLARFTEFDWGPPAASLPYLPRVRYRRAILTPATWRITVADHIGMLAAPDGWAAAFHRWRQRWHCPDTVELHDDHRSLRLDLTVDAHLTVLRQHLDKHGGARLTETESTVDTGWIGGHFHEIVMPFARVTAPAPNLVGGCLPVLTNATGTHRPAAPDTSWFYMQIFTHPERIDEILRLHLPELLATLGEPTYWFARYRSVRETDHLRLRIRTQGPDHYAALALAVGAWAQQLVDAAAASRWTLASYHPEVGRYGGPTAMTAAEDVFATDSHAVALALRLLPSWAIHPVALTAIGMIDIAEGFHPDPAAATEWLVRHLASKAAPSADQAAADQVRAWAKTNALADGTTLPAELVAAWQDRREALARYRAALPTDADRDQILSALLHMHHNRARAIDRDDEATCLRLARQAALTRRITTTGGSP